MQRDAVGIDPRRCTAGRSNAVRTYFKRRWGEKGVSYGSSFLHAFSRWQRRDRTEQGSCSKDLRSLHEPKP